MAANYFLANNMQVYWPAVKQGADDFVVLTREGFRRVQVKMASWVNHGNFRWLRAKTTSDRRAAFEEYDLLAVVHGENLWIIPANVLTSQIITMFKNNPDAAPNRWEPYRHAISVATGDTTGDADV